MFLVLHRTRNNMWSLWHIHVCCVSACPDYSEPDVMVWGQKLGSTFRPTVEEGYTVPFTFNLYDTPGKLLEHTEPLTPEPEYATPFSDQHPDPNLATPQGTLNNNKHVLPMVSTGTRTTITQAQYDCPSHRELPNGYCTTSLHANGSRPASVVYTEPELLLSDSLLQHTYEEPFWIQQAQPVLLKCYILHAINVKVIYDWADTCSIYCECSLR